MKWLIGLAAGAAVIYFLQTDKGKEFMEGIKKEACNMGDRLTALAEDLLANGTSFAERKKTETDQAV